MLTMLFSSPFSFESVSWRVSWFCFFSSLFLVMESFGFTSLGLLGAMTLWKKVSMSKIKYTVARQQLHFAWDKGTQNALLNLEWIHPAQFEVRSHFYVRMPPHFWTTCADNMFHASLASKLWGFMLKLWDLSYQIVFELFYQNVIL